MGFDIGLAPLLNDTFHRSKTNNKFREYGACGIAGVYSRADVYTECIEDGKTGILVENDAESWYEGMRRLVEDDELRAAISKAAKEQVERDYSQEFFKQVWKRQIWNVLENAEPPRRPSKDTSLWARVKRVARRAWFVITFPFRWGPINLIRNFRSLMTNFWLLYKINYLKRL
jgi:hypothetical protein